MHADRAAILAAISGAGDPHVAQLAATQAHAAQHDAWLALAGDVLYTAGAEAGTRLTSALQSSAVAVPDYNPDDDGADALTVFVAAQQPALASSVQDHTGGMLTTALAAALLAASSGTHPTQPLSDAVNGLYDQWLGEGDTGSDYAGSLAGDWTAMGWNHGEYDAATQVEASTADSGDGSGGVQRTWTATMDAHTRPEHAAADGQTVGLHDPFDVGGESLMYPMDPTGSPGNTINCRCSVSYSIAGVGIGDLSGDDSMAE